MPLLVTSAAGANGNGFNGLLAFDLGARSAPSVMTAVLPIRVAWPSTCDCRERQLHPCNLTVRQLLQPFARCQKPTLGTASVIDLAGAAKSGMRIAESCRRMDVW
jgi:hypothetical protein